MDIIHAKKRDILNLTTLKYNSINHRDQRFFNLGSTLESDVRISHQNLMSIMTSKIDPRAERVNGLKLDNLTQF